MWTPGYKNKHFASQKEMFSWNLLSYPVSQLSNVVTGWFELSCSQETQCFKNFKNIQVCTMSCRISRLWCSASTQKQLTWNTNRTRSEQNSCGRNSRRCWRSKFEIKIGVLQTLFDRYWYGEWKTQSIQLRHVILRHASAKQHTGLSIQRTELCCKSQPCICVHSGKHWGWNV